MKRCFDLMDALDLDSIAFPAVGAGAARFSYTDVAINMAGVISDRLLHSDRPMDVSLYLFDRFGRMQTIDFIQFFEEFARCVPQLRSEPTSTPEAAPPVPRSVSGAGSAVIAQREARLQLKALTEERAELEERSALLKDSDKNQEALRSHVDAISAERINLLRSLQQYNWRPVSLFISYSHKDQDLRVELEKHLSILKRLGVIETWNDRNIAAGSEWQGAIDENLRSAQVVLLLVSPDFMASDYCYDMEVKCAMERHNAGNARVIPVILRTVMWDQAPFAKLQALPRDGKPIRSWPDLDAAFDDVARGIRAAVESMAIKVKQ